jgi:enolase-phosphatase E1
VNERSIAGVCTILLDIEGTTTPIAFVYEVLFPYARRHLWRHIEQHMTDPGYARLFDQLRDAVPSEVRPASPADHAEWLIARDSKATALKDLQGKIWQEGYQRGELVGEVFEDVPRAFERWHAKGVQIGIFSSGSILAQQLLFRHSSAGDLSGFIQRHFDTTTGAKTDVGSYRQIANAMAMPAGDILFVSDTTRELDAARAAAMRTRLAIRPGNSPAAPGHGHAVVESFDSLN